MTTQTLDNLEEGTPEYRLMKDIIDLAITISTKGITHEVEDELRIIAIKHEISPMLVLARFQKVIALYPNLQINLTITAI